jgi:hypothetical protein
MAVVSSCCEMFGSVLLTNVTLIFSYSIKFKKFNLHSKKLLMIYKMKVRMTSSRHDPYKLGYTRVTIVITIRSKNVNWSKSLKIILVRIVLCNSRI